MIKFLFILILVFSSVQADAGWKSKVVIAGFTEQYIARTMMTAVIEGKNIERAISIAKKVSKTSIGRKYLYNLLSENLITNPYSLAAANSIAIISGSNLDTSSFNKQLITDKKNYETHIQTLTAIGNRLTKTKKFECFNKLLIYSDGVYIPLNKYNKPVSEWDYGSYKELKSVEKITDKLEHDHIPSIGAVLSYLHKRDGVLYNRNLATGLIINNNATTLEVKQDLHRNGRTFGGKNTDKKIEDDSLNLKIATIKDLAYHFKSSSTLSRKMIESFSNVYARNEYLCLYEEL